MANPERNREGLEHDPFWYKNGVIYEVHVRAFLDTNGDGTGDFRGLTEKLDYIKDLGVTAIWLLPFYPSPLKDDGYDIADYCDVHPKYGSLADFKTFMREAHRRGLRIITELVLNHTSDQHDWFQRARRAKPGSRWRNFYVWSDTGTEYSDTRIIFKDVELSNWAWDSVARAYYWHRFFSHQPDLNFDNPEVHEAMIRVVDFWLEMGVDGLRLDAVPYLYERENTNCENLPETHAFLKKLRRHVDERFSDRMLLGEANQWPEDAVSYFGQGKGDECHMAFHFPLMPRLFMSLRMEDRQPIVDILDQTPAIPETSQWALFLRNHDELTVEMVTDEERDYLYRMYAHVPQARLNLGIRRRLAPLLNNDRKSIELLNALLFSLPGTPALYYGDEIGLGENIFLADRNGVRTPMQWSSDKNAGFSRANPQSLYLPIILDPGYHYEANNVEVQLANPHSLLWWMRRILALRKRWRALGEGRCEFLQPENRRILAYILRYQQETLLIVANLSRFTQPVELDLPEFKQLIPVELFGQTEFPEIGDRPYFLSLGPHSFFWFSIEQKSARARMGPPAGVSVRPASLALARDWREILAEKNRSRLKEVLSEYLKSQPWFATTPPRTIKTVSISERFSFPMAEETGAGVTFLFLQVDYVDGGSEVFTLPITFAQGSDADWFRRHSPVRIIAEVSLSDGPQTGVLGDAFGSPGFGKALMEMVWHRRSLAGDRGRLEGFRDSAMRDLVGTADLPGPSLVPIEQANSSEVYGDKLILKLFRRLDIGVNPELEITKFLSAMGFPNAPAFAGAIKYCGPDDKTATLAVVNTFVPGSRNGWNLALDALSQYYDRAITWVAQKRQLRPSMLDPLEPFNHEIPAEPREALETVLEPARLLGVRTAELHEVLASDAANPDFAPEEYTGHDRRGIFQAMRNQATRNLRLLRRQARSFAPPFLDLAQRVGELEQAIIQTYRTAHEHRLSARRIRIHGDFHLGQVLWTGKDFMFIDFEGKSGVPVSERRIKRSPLRDVATMVHSFHYAAHAALERHVERGSIQLDEVPRFEPWTQYWVLWVSTAYLTAYFQTIGRSQVLPANEEAFRLLLRAYLLNCMVDKLGHELNKDARALQIPLHGILSLVGQPVPAEPPPSNGAPEVTVERRVTGVE